MTEARALLDGSVSERDFQRTVIELAKVRGWLVYHALPARTKKGWRTLTQGDVGFPDLVMVRPPRLIFAELKSEKGKMTVEQESWQDALVGCIVLGRPAIDLQGRVSHPTPEVYVWHPSEMEDIQIILQR